jgi:glutaminyl-tRNA synthetase
MVLRAKIDMGSPNMNMRDPTIYRIKKATHHRTGNDWCIYPMYDFAHTLSDAIEGTTHSLCTLEFEDHRPLYEWFLDNLNFPSRPRQIEFSRLNVENTITSKSKLAELIESGDISNWDDPRLPTISGLRRRGYPASAIREFCKRVGITKKD